MDANFSNRRLWVYRFPYCRLYIANSHEVAVLDNLSTARRKNINPKARLFEIDLIEEREGKLFGYEAKWQKDKTKPPKEFLAAYNNATYQVITKDNYLDFVA